MAPLPGFTNNPLQDRTNHYLAILSLLQPLLPYFSPSKALITLPSHHNKPSVHERRTAGIQTFAAPLYLVAATRLGFRSIPEPHTVSNVLETTQPWLDGLNSAFDPSCEDYWGPGNEAESKVVQVVAWVFVECKSEVWDFTDDKTKKHVVTWLGQVVDAAEAEEKDEGVDVNWAKLFAGAALKRLGVRDVKGTELEALGKLYESCSDGWLAGEEGVLASAEEQFRSLLFADMYDASGFRPLREKSTELAKVFSWDVQGFMNMEGIPIGLGDMIPQTLSLPSFLAALAYTKTPHLLGQTPHPVGILKSFIVRTLRWLVASTSNDFDESGILRTPENYWTLKPFIIVALHRDDSFWLADEVGHHWDPMSPKFLALRRGKLPSKNPDYGRVKIPHGLHGWC